MVLFAGAHGYLDEWPVESVKDYESQMLEYMESKHQALLTEIKDAADISDELEETLNKALDDFKESVFQAAS